MSEAVPATMSLFCFGHSHGHLRDHWQVGKLAKAHACQRWVSQGIMSPIGTLAWCGFVSSPEKLEHDSTSSLSPGSDICVRDVWIFSFVCRDFN